MFSYSVFLVPAAVIGCVWH